MNWKAEFSKAGELALRCGTLMVLGFGLLALGRGRGFKGGSMVYLDLAGNPMGWALMAAFLAVLFFGCYRRNVFCALVGALMLNLAGAAVIGSMWGGFFLDGLKYFSIGNLATDTYVGLLVWALGLLLLALRVGRTMLSLAIYVLVSAPVILFEIALADLR